MSHVSHLMSDCNRNSHCYLFSTSFICLFVRLFIHLFVCLFVRLFVCLFVRLFVHLFVCSRALTILSEVRVVQDVIHPLIESCTHI